ncbi:MAG: DUF4126 domain-containing protein [Erythrobacter sp.]|nr:MAG: DUF4126 domain-containing protein [Erythrobacter sp.]
MIRSILMGLVAGQRSMIPLAATAAAARNGTLPKGAPLERLIGHPLIAGGTVALAAAEMAGDKMKTAPDRIVPLGLIARTLTSAYAGAALAPRGSRVAGGAVAVVTAIGASYVGWRLRCAAMKRYGQTATGAVEDALVLGSGLGVALAPR